MSATMPNVKAVSDNNSGEFIFTGYFIEIEFYQFKHFFFKIVITTDTFLKKQANFAILVI